MSTFVAVDVAETGETFHTFLRQMYCPSSFTVIDSSCSDLFVRVWVTCFCVIPVVVCAVSGQRAGTLQTVTRP